MTEAEQHKRIAALLNNTVALSEQMSVAVDEIVKARDLLEKRADKLMELAARFDRGEYRRDPDATGHDDPPPGPGESDAA